MGMMRESVLSALEMLSRDYNPLNHHHTTSCLSSVKILSEERRKIFFKLLTFGGGVREKEKCKWRPSQSHNEPIKIFSQHTLSFLNVKDCMWSRVSMWWFLINDEIIYGAYKIDDSNVHMYGWRREFLRVVKKY